MWEELLLSQFYRGATKGTDPWGFLARVKQQVAEPGFKPELCELKSPCSAMCLPIGIRLGGI